MRYAIKGYTSSHPDFTDEIELADNFDFEGARYGGDPRYVGAQRAALKAALLDSACDTEYLNVFDDSDFEVRDDLADMPGQIVLLAESFGCENCSERGNDFEDGCDEDAPHGAFMIILTPIMVCVDCGVDIYIKHDDTVPDSELTCLECEHDAHRNGGCECPGCLEPSDSDQARGN